MFLAFFATISIHEAFASVESVLKIKMIITEDVTVAPVTRMMVAVNHVPPTQCVIVMSCIRVAYVFVTSRKVTIWHAFIYFIS